MRTHPIRGTLVRISVPSPISAIPHALRSKAALLSPGAKGLGFLSRR